MNAYFLKFQRKIKYQLNIDFNVNLTIEIKGHFCVSLTHINCLTWPMFYSRLFNFYQYEKYYQVLMKIRAFYNKKIILLYMQLTWQNFITRVSGYILVLNKMQPTEVAIINKPELKRQWNSWSESSWLYSPLLCPIKRSYIDNSGLKADSYS